VEGEGTTATLRLPRPRASEGEQAPVPLC